MTIDPVEIIKQFYPRDTPLFNILMNHSRVVTRKSLEIGRSLQHLKPNLEFIEKAAMLHDIGIFLTRAKSIGCNGQYPYISHGYLGKNLLDDLGLPSEYGLVCERHTGAGITKENIELNKLPLPHRDMVPITLEEKIICVADKYHSKSPKRSSRKISTREIIEELKKIHPEHSQRFTEWAKEFHLI